MSEIIIAFITRDCQTDKARTFRRWF